MQFLLGHYVPLWFRIRCHSACDAGAKNLFLSVQLLRALPPTTQRLVQPVLARNAYWAHPEQLLLAMAADEDRGTRQKAVLLIQQARERQQQERQRAAEQEEQVEVREFQLPTLNFEASTVDQMIDWEKENVTEPPLLRDLDDERLRSIAEAPLELAPYPVHTQAVERAVKIVTTACAKVHGEVARHSYICAKLKHRRALPSFNCKQDLSL